MPTPVAFLLNRPVTTFNRVRNAARGSRLLLSSMSAPAPLAHQWFGLIPLPMNSAAKRLGKADGPPPDAVSPPHPGRDSSQGRAMATPTPRSMVRRSMGESNTFMDRSPKLPAGGANSRRPEHLVIICAGRPVRQDKRVGRTPRRLRSTQPLLHAPDLTRRHVADTSELLIRVDRLGRAYSGTADW